MLRWQHTHTGLTLCGGGSFGVKVHQTCTTYNEEEGKWVDGPRNQLREERNSHVGWNSPGGIMLLGGRWTNTWWKTELLSADSSTRKFRLQYETM